MSMFRNFGSALTMGGVETSKAKEARERYVARCERHEEAYKAYKGFADEAAQQLEGLWRQAQRGRELIIGTDALLVDDEGNLQGGWYPVQGSVPTRSGVAIEGAANSADVPSIAAAAGSPAMVWVAVGSLSTASTRAAIGNLSRAAPASFALTGFNALTAASFLGLDFWKARQREQERLDSIRQATEAIEQREAEMQSHRNRLESILPEISPAIDELASSAVDAKSANDTRLASISEMRSTLAACCAKVSEALQETTSAIDNARGSREDLRALSDRSRDVTSAAAELQTESNRQEAAVNEETSRTTVVLNKLAAAIETADELISNSRTEGAN